VNAPVRAVTFDAAGTLIRVAAPVGETYAAIARAHGARLEPRALDAAFREAFPRMPPMAFPELRGAALARAERSWWRDLVTRVVTSEGGVGDFEPFFEDVFGYYAKGEAWRAYEEVEPVLSALRSRGIRIGVVSNFDSRLPGILHQLGLAQQFDAVVYSTIAGAVKPEPAIFHRALASLDARAEESLHVGDGRVPDYEGARAAGMAALLVDRRGKGGPDPDTTVTDLRGVLHHIGTEHP